MENIRGWVQGSGRFVLFTCDPLAFRRSWLSDYFPFLRDEERIFMPRDQLQTLLKRHWREVHSFDFPLPPDLQDQFQAVHRRHPERYTRPAVLDGMSAFAKQQPDTVGAGIMRPPADLDSGAWQLRYGVIRTLESYDAGYYLLRASGASP